MTEDAPATGTGSTTTEQVKEQVTQKAEVAQEKARGRFRDQVDQRSTQAGERLSGTAADVRSVAEELRRQGKDTPARMVEQAAGQADRAADYLKTASGDRILRDVEDLARSKPWAVVAGGLALGFAASRFLKASSRRRYLTGRDDHPTPTSRPGPYAAQPTWTIDAPLDDVRDPADPDVRPPRAE
jgi:hypothetical protein